MFAAIRRAGKEKLRVQYDLVVHELRINVPDGTMMRIRWKRGSSTENRTMDRPVKGGSVVFNDAMTIICTLWHDGDENVFLEKESTLQVLAVEPNTGNPVKHGSLSFPLEHHAVYGAVVEEKGLTLPLVNGGTLALCVSSRCVDRMGGDSEEFSGSDRSSLNDYPFPWDEAQDWEDAAPVKEEMEQLIAQLEQERRERGGQLQDLHDEMVSQEEEIKVCKKNELKAQKALAEAESRCSKLQTENSILKEEVETEMIGNQGQDDLLIRIDELQNALSVSEQERQVLEVSCADLHAAVAELEQAGQQAADQKSRADKLEKENKRLQATVSMLQSELDGGN